MTTHAQQAIEDAGLPDLASSAAAGDVTAVVEQLAAGCNVDERCSDGMTALMLAAAFGHRDVLSTLLDRGATVDLAREDGVTALSLAAFFGRHPIVRELVIRGANVAVIGRHRAALEAWAESHGLIDETDPSLETVILEEHQPREIEPQPEQNLVSPFAAPVLLAEAQPAAQSNSVYQFDCYADEQRAVSPASVWAPDYEEVSCGRIGNSASAELLVSAEPSGSHFAPVDISEEFTFLNLEAQSDFQPLDDWEALAGLVLDPVGDPAAAPESDPVMDDDDEVTAELPSISEAEALSEEASITEDPADRPETMSAPAVAEFFSRETYPGPELEFVKVASRAPALDESIVLPSEAYSISKLEFVRAASCAPVLGESTALPSQTYPTPEPEFVRAAKRARVLDESIVLPGEASFATVPLFQGATRSYSPGVEFVTKLSNWRRIGIPVFLMILAGVGAAWVEIRYATARNIFKSFNEVQAKQTTAPAPQPAYVIPASTKRASAAPLAVSTLANPKSAPVGTAVSDKQTRNQSQRQPTGLPL